MFVLTQSVYLSNYCLATFGGLFFQCIGASKQVRDRSLHFHRCSIIMAPKPTIKKKAAPKKKAKSYTADINDDGCANAITAHFFMKFP